MSALTPRSRSPRGGSPLRCSQLRTGLVPSRVHRPITDPSLVRTAHPGHRFEDELPRAAPPSGHGAAGGLGHHNAVTDPRNQALRRQQPQPRTTHLAVGDQLGEHYHVYTVFAPEPRELLRVKVAAYCLG